MWFLGITDQCVNYSWFSWFCFLYWDIWGNRDWKKTLYLILYCISKVVKIPRMSHTMTRGSTLMDKHFSRLVEVYPFLYHMRMHCQNSLFCKKTIGLHCGCQKQTFLESDFTLRLSLANLSGNSGLKSSCHFTIFNAWQELNFGVKIQINLGFIIMKLSMHGSFKVF